MLIFVCRVYQKDLTDYKYFCLYLLSIHRLIVPKQHNDLLENGPVSFLRCRGGGKQLVGLLP